MRNAIATNAIFLEHVTAGKLFEDQYDTAAAAAAAEGEAGGRVDSGGNAAAAEGGDGTSPGAPAGKRSRDLGRGAGGSSSSSGSDVVGGVRSSNFDMGKVRSTLRQYARCGTV